MDRRAVGSIVTKDEAGVEEDEVEEPAELDEGEASVNQQAKDRGAEAAEPDRRYPGTPA